MKTDDLVSALTADLQTCGPTPGAVSLRIMPVAVVVVALLFFVFLGIRQDFSSVFLSAVAFKLLVMGVLAATAAYGAMRLMVPGQPLHGLRILWAGPLLLLMFVVFDLAGTGTIGWQSRMFGENGLRCLMIIPLLSLAPLVALLYVARSGAVTQHRKAGAIAGLAATGIAASFYALHCTDDSPLFVAAWYSLSAMISMGLGAIGCRLFVRW